MRLIAPVLVFIILFGCNTTKTHTNRVDKTPNSIGDLVHTVYFSVKEGKADSLLSACKQIQSIPVVHNFEVGSFKDLDDPRALTQYGIVMQMHFKDTSDYYLYQSHPIHLKLKQQVGSMLLGPPATHDFIIK